MIAIRTTSDPAEATPGDFTPAVVTYGPNNTARVVHPLGTTHENARLTVERLTRKGFRVILATPRTNHP